MQGLRGSAGRAALALAVARGVGAREAQGPHFPR